MKLLETIRFENGSYDNLDYHQNRMNASRKELFGFDDELDLLSILQSKTKRKAKKKRAISSFFSGFINCRQAHVLHSSGFLKEDAKLFKCRLTYSKEIGEIEFVPYQIPKIQSLKIVVDDQIDYKHKFLDRSHLDQLFQQKGNCDDILIVKNGLITDTYFANILFFDGKNWITPAKPLLKGTQRENLLEKEIIKTAEIRVEDLKSFKKARLINAMIRFEDELDIKIENIRF